MFKINNTMVKFHKDYTKFPRTKVTTSIRSEYYKEYQTLIDSMKEDYCRGFDIMIEMLGENQEYLNEFIKRLKEY